MIGSLVLALTAPTIALAEAPAGLAERAWSVSEAVLSRSIDPPTRQQMLLAGLRAARAVAKQETPPALAREVSDAITLDRFAALFDRAWPSVGPQATAGEIGTALIEGMLATVPGEAELLSAKDLRVAEQVEGNLYVGVQIAVTYDDAAKLVSIANVLPGGPAEKAGARVGDRIAAVEGLDVTGVPLKEVIDRLRGPLGTEVMVRLLREKASGPIDLKMVRAVLPRVTVEGFRKRADGGWDVRVDGPAPIGYLKITEIVGSTPVELARFAAQFESEGIKALILDLRKVGHGGLHPTILLADALLDGGTIGRIRSADSVETIKAEPDESFPGLPIAVLVDGSMTPESRWLCAALEDNARAAIIGVPGGQGRDVHTAVPLPGGDWSIRIATGRLERGDGRPCPETAPPARRDGLAANRLDREYPIPSLNLRPAVGPPASGKALVDPIRKACEVLGPKLKEAGS